METIRELTEIRSNYLSKDWQYERCYYNDFNYKILENCIYRKSHKYANTTYNDITIMIDTETSKPTIKEWSEYDDIYNDIKNTRFKWNKDFKEVCNKSNGIINFGGSTYIDSYYEELSLEYPWIFKNTCYSDIDCLYELWDFMQKNEPEEQTRDNIIVIWTLSIRLFDINICTLYGRTPSELMDCIKMILNVLKGDETYMYIFNLAYDYVFLRKFLFKEFGFPITQLNVKPHQPINLKFENGLVLKDALILAQRSLKKWASDLNVEHQKAVGDWDYTIVRHQNTKITERELHYAEYDTLAGVECIDTLKNQLKKDIGTMPATSTGILRELIKKVGAEYKAKKWFNKCCPSWSQYQKMVKLYHGGYTHGNRHYLDEIIKVGKPIQSIDYSKYPYPLIPKIIKGYDFVSSYPYHLMYEYPTGKFVEIGNKSIDFILKNSKEYAFMFKLRAYHVELKDDFIAMPFLQYSKCILDDCKLINDITDNGRVIACDYCEIWLNEIDLAIIQQQYIIELAVCTDVEVSKKGYLPRWFTDVVFDLFKDKCTLKDKDKVLYTIQKYKLNACYGLACQRWDKLLILETEDGEYITDDSISAEDAFNKTIKKRSTILPYFIGCWCTSYAVYDLYRLGSMCKIWLYSDTDSCYGIEWNEEKVKKYNDECIRFIKSRGYSGVEYKGKIYHLGIAETEPEIQYKEFCYQGAKRYAGRCIEDNKIHITVAGVPKQAGARCLYRKVKLKDVKKVFNYRDFKKPKNIHSSTRRLNRYKWLKSDLSLFTSGFIFEGQKTGKLTHTHIYIDDIYINDYGDEVGDSIDLTSCDYKLDTVQFKTIDDYINHQVDICIPIAEDCSDLDLIY